MNALLKRQGMHAHTANSDHRLTARRTFLGAAAAGAMIAPGLFLIRAAGAASGDLPEGVTGPVSSKVRWGMLVDTTLCVKGCDACVSACNAENALTEGTASQSQKSQWIRKVELKEKSTGREVSLPMMCQHCEKPPCVDVCPTGASFKRNDGIVLVDRHICIGCRYCMMACPYKARSFVHESLDQQNPEVPRGMGCVESCTFCVHRVDKAQQPACVEACAAQGKNALAFGDLNDPNSDISRTLKDVNTRQIRADLALNTGVRYRGI